MVDKGKTDKELGHRVHEHLLKLGVETPMLNREAKPHDFSVNNIAENMAKIMSILGLSLEDDSLEKTPLRVAKMLVDETCYGLDYNNFPKITTFENKMNMDTMLIERHIKVFSLCEHHFQNIIGEAAVAYVPKDRIVGLSKINRLVDFFCRRPQVQERLTEQIFHALSYILDTDNVAVTIRAEHLCVKVRGVQDINSDTLTTKLGGNFYSGNLRNEYYQSLKL